MNIHKASNFSDSQFLQKMQKFHLKLSKCFAHCKLQTANSNPVQGN